MRLWHRLTGDMTTRGQVALAMFAALLLAAPAFIGSYPLSILILVVYFAYIGQAWNVMMGFAGQLSLGHALYLGLGGYTAAALAFHFGVSPWIGMIAGVLVAMLAGGIVGFLGFRFSLAGVYFALLTIAFAEFTRILFDHFKWVGGSAGLFLKVSGDPGLWHLRGGPVMFYYVILAMAALALVACRLMLTSRLGYHWLAIREDPEAAQASGVDVFRGKMIAVLISSGMAAVGGVWAALLQEPVPRDRLRHGPLDRGDPGADHRWPGHSDRTVHRRGRAGQPGRRLHHRRREDRRDLRCEDRGIEADLLRPRAARHRRLPPRRRLALARAQAGLRA